LAKHQTIRERAAFQPRNFASGQPRRVADFQCADTRSLDDGHIPDTICRLYFRNFGAQRNGWPRDLAPSAENQEAPRNRKPQNHQDRLSLRTISGILSKRWIRYRGQSRVRSQTNILSDRWLDRPNRESEHTLFPDTDRPPQTQSDQSRTGACSIINRRWDNQKPPERERGISRT
jgi:hypothetical protein